MTKRSTSSVNTAHNIRTPLSLVLAPLADLAKDAHLGDKSRRFLEMAQRNGDKASEDG